MQKIENHEQMREFVEKEKKRLEVRQNKIKELISNNKYITWLDKFTNKYSTFRDDDFLYDKDNLSKEDLENVDNLNLLFNGIENYAKDNFIYPYADSDFVNYYRIMYNNFGYEIGVITGQGTLFFCEKTNYIDDSFIDFNDIILNKKQKNTDLINKRLAELSSIITYFYEQNVPLFAIKSTVTDTLWQIEENSIKSTKKLLKKI